PPFRSGGVTEPNAGGADAPGETGVSRVRPPGRRLLRVAPRLGGVDGGRLSDRALPGRRGDCLRRSARARVPESASALGSQTRVPSVGRARDLALGPDRWTHAGCPAL